MAGEWGQAPWGGEAPTEAAGSGTGYWGVEAGLPVIQAIVPTCGTQSIAVDQTITFDVLDPRVAPPTPGIDLALTTVTMLINTGPAEIVYTGGAFTADWLASSTTTPITGPPVGYAFSLSKAANFPYGASISLTIVVFNNDGESTTHTCRFVVVPVVSLTSVQILSLRRIRVNFSTAIKSTDLAALTNPSNWIVRPIPGNTTQDYNNMTWVKSVHYERRYNPRFVILDVHLMQPNQRYEVWPKGFNDVHARTFDGSLNGASESRRTKLDSVLDGLPELWVGSAVSNVFWTLAAMAIEDEAIGGAQGVVLSDPLDRNF